MPDRPKIIDAEFEIVSGPYRVGDPHPVKKRWLWTGLYDKKGDPLWYRPPRFNKWQFTGLVLFGCFAALCLFVLAVTVWRYISG